MKRFFWVLFVMSLWGHLLMAQEKAVSGIVVSTEDGLPMHDYSDDRGGCRRQADDEWRNHQRKRRVFDDRFSSYENTASLLLGI